MIVVVGVRRVSCPRNRAITSRTHGLGDIKHVKKVISIKIKKMNEKINTWGAAVRHPSLSPFKFSEWWWHAAIVAV